MKFSTAIVALAGVSSTNAALRGVLPANMKELLTDKFAAVQDTCQDFYDAENECEDTDACESLYTGSGSCPMMCNYSYKVSKNICVQRSDELVVLPSK
mmetsp:Transcript_18989/g.31950  ORF Transcript_18989/g.31950 Transcript_18989/m.31950 type:complete len:98 (-) Transcript_18989:174-467(-)